MPRHLGKNNEFQRRLPPEVSRKWLIYKVVPQRDARKTDRAFLVSIKIVVNKLLGETWGWRFI